MTPSPPSTAAQRIVQSAIDHFGRLDILINNAGILRDKSFAKMSPDMWQAVLDVHLHGAFNVTQPAFQIMRQQGYGRIVLTTSAAGLFGNFGQANYGSAKLALVGLMNTLKLEGAKYDIKVNTVAPLATTRLTQDVLPPDFADKLKPEFVAPLVLYLCSEAVRRFGPDPERRDGTLQPGSDHRVHPAWCWATASRSPRWVRSTRTGPRSTACGERKCTRTPTRH